MRGQERSRTVDTRLHRLVSRDTWDHARLAAQEGTVLAASSRHNYGLRRPPCSHAFASETHHSVRRLARYKRDPERTFLAANAPSYETHTCLHSGVTTQGEQGARRGHQACDDNGQEAAPPIPHDAVKGRDARGRSACAFRGRGTRQAAWDAQKRKDKDAPQQEHRRLRTLPASRGQVGQGQIELETGPHGRENAIGRCARRDAVAGSQKRARGKQE
ncbi:hypothetical protein ERJ75_001790300 [Trypanosoma vivax]|nr:hypothetical protein ERJ75_001790300 [Trypanosoma vivax]